MSDAVAVPAPLVAESTERPTMVRWMVVFLAGLLAIVIYIHRSSIAAASTTIEGELKLNDSWMGLIKAAFSCGYFFQFIGGYLNSRFGNRLVLAGMAVASSLAMLGMSQARSPFDVWVCMACIGLSQAGIIPCVGQVVRDWIPQNRRASAGAVFTGCMSVGSAVASGVTGTLLEYGLSWRIVYMAFAALGVLWAVVFVWVFRNRPSEHQRVNQAERDLILAGRESESALPPPVTLAVWKGMLTSWNQWFNCLQQFFRNFAYTFFITWYPAFLENAYGVSRKEAGLMNMVPLITTFFGILAGGQLIDAVLRHTGNKYLSRSVTAAGGHLVYAVSILAASVAPNPWTAAVLIGFGMLFFGIGSPATWAATLDISGRYTTLFFAFMNACGVIAGVICPIVVGLMTEQIKQGHGSWNHVLYLFAFINACAAVTWLCINSTHPARLPE